MVAWLLPWLLVAGLIGIGIWVAVDALGNDDLETPVVAGDTPSPSPTPRVKPSATPSPTPVIEKPSPEPSEAPEDEPEVELITEGMTVQVLNGSSDTAADDDMANRLTELGYEVVAINGADRAYDLTTVFWSYAESQEAAERLAARFGWQVAAKPENLSTTVALHVVVGLDYVPR